MVLYSTSHLPSRNTPRFRRDKKLEIDLRKMGLTYRTTLDWGADSNHVHADSTSVEDAERLIRENASLLTRAYDIIIPQELYIAPLAVR